MQIPHHMDIVTDTYTFRYRYVLHIRYYPGLFSDVKVTEVYRRY